MSLLRCKRASSAKSAWGWETIRGLTSKMVTGINKTPESVFRIEFFKTSNRNQFHCVVNTNDGQLYGVVERMSKTKKKKKTRGKKK